MRRDTLPKVALATAAAILLTAVVGCTAMRRNAARTAYGFVHHQPVERIWPELRQMLFEEGYQTRDSDGTWTLETEWLPDSHGRARVLATGTPLGPDRTQIEITRMTQQLNSDIATTDRAYDLEWELVQRVDPQAAAEISADAEKHAIKAVPE